MNERVFELRRIYASLSVPAVKVMSEPDMVLFFLDFCNLSYFLIYSKWFSN